MVSELYSKKAVVTKNNLCHMVSFRQNRIQGKKYTVLWKHELIASMGKRHVKSIRDLFSRPSMVKGMRKVRAKLWGVWQPLTANMSQSQVVKQFELYSVGF